MERTTSRMRFGLGRTLVWGALLVGAAASVGCPGPETAEVDSSTRREGSAAERTPASPTDSSAETDASAVSVKPETSESTIASPNDARTSSTTPMVEPTPSSTDPIGAVEPPSTSPGPTGVPSTTDEPAAAAEDDADEGLAAPAEYEGWSTPAVALVVSGRLNGYIEPCGCTGLSEQKGGLLRRDTMITQLRDRGWEVLPIDLGNQEHRHGPQASIKFARTVEAMAGIMGYRAIGIGPDDLALPSIDLVQSIENSGGNGNVFASANVALFGDYLPKLQIVESAGKKIGITSVLGPKGAATVNNSDVELLDLDASLRETSEAMSAAGCDLKVLMAYASMEETEAIARAHAGFDLVICSGVDGEPTLEPTYVTVGDRRVPVIQTGYKGMYVGVVGWFPGEENPLRYQRVPLDSRFEDSERIKSIFIRYQDQLETLGLEGLELRPISHPSGNRFVGSEACADCHTTAYRIWKEGVDGEGGPHSHATESLVEPGERTWVKRHFDPECLSCHVTGWNPQKYFPYDGGYVGLEASRALHGNGCENCHGPGERHVAAENGDLDVTADELVSLQQQMKVKLEATLCMECHDLDNSPDFHEPGAFEKYWARIVHEGKD